jgi:hypothetical protein
MDWEAIKQLAADEMLTADEGFALARIAEQAHELQRHILSECPHCKAPRVMRAGIFGFQHTADCPWTALKGVRGDGNATR